MFVIDYAVVGPVRLSERNTIAINNCIEADEKLSLHLVDENKFGGKCLLVVAESETFEGVPSAEWLLIDVPEDLIESLSVHGLLLIDLASNANVEFQGLAIPKDQENKVDKNQKYMRA